MNWQILLESKIMKFTAIVTSIAAVVGIFYNVITFADERWDEDGLIQEMQTHIDSYAEERVQAVQQHVDTRLIQFQIQEYQDSIQEIKDMEIDGVAKPRHLKKKHRYEDRIIDLKESLRQIGP